jgi:hypothetical protein
MAKPADRFAVGPGGFDREAIERVGRRKLRVRTDIDGLKKISSS